MAQKISPIYHAIRARHVIDSCEPQRRAVQAGKIRFHSLTKGHYPGLPLKPSELPGISSIGFWDADQMQDWGLEPHRNEGIEIAFLESGAMAFTVEATNFDLHSGQFTITRPWQLHKLGAPNIGPGKLHWLVLDVGVRRPNQNWRWPRWVTLTTDDKAELTRKLRHNENPVWNSSPEIVAAFRGLADCVLKWNKPRVESRMITLLNQLLLGILSTLTEQQLHQNPDLTSRRRTVDLFLRDLAENPGSSNERWTLPAMAQHCGMGITTFCKFCRELVNNGPMEYLSRCRLERAARQLREQPERTVTEIAFENGFNTSQYFATAFQLRFRCSPRDYRGER